VVDGPPLAAEVGEDVVVAGADPAVAVAVQERRAAGPTVGWVGVVLRSIRRWLTERFVVVEVLAGPVEERANG
jgi:hypothetical protein